MVSAKRVNFFTKFNITEKRNNYAKSRLADIKLEIADFEGQYVKDMTQYKQFLRAWQLRLAYWAFDTGFEIFPPELKSRDQLALDRVDEEEDDGEGGNSVGYCVNCLCR